MVNDGWVVIDKKSKVYNTFDNFPSKHFYNNYYYKKNYGDWIVKGSSSLIEFDEPIATEPIKTKLDKAVKLDKASKVITTIGKISVVSGFISLFPCGFTPFFVLSVVFGAVMCSLALVFLYFAESSHWVKEAESQLQKAIDEVKEKQNPDYERALKELDEEFPGVSVVD